MALHPQVRALVEAAPDPPSGAGLEAARAAYLETALELGGALEPVGEVRDLVVPGGAEGVSLRGQAYWPQHGEPCAVLLWLHGGGWCLGDVPSFERVARSLANACGAVSVLVEYRLAPEHPFPAARDDAIAAIEWAAGDPFGLDVPLVVGGDSAGGNLATVALRHRPGLAALQVLAYPVCDTSLDWPSYTQFDDERTLSRSDMAAMIERYGCPTGDADAAPVRASLQELSVLPPTIVLTAEEDVLRDEAEAYAQRLREAGVDCELHRVDGMIHGFLRWGGVVDAARDAFKLVGARVRAAAS